MLYRISVAERSLTGIAKIFRSRLSRLDDLLRAGTVPLKHHDIAVFSFHPVVSSSLLNSSRSIKTILHIHFASFTLMLTIMT